MPVSWFLLSLALGRNPVVVSLERLMEPQDTARCSLGLSCHLWDGDVLCLPGSLQSAPGPVLVPTRLQTELVLRCPQKTDCALCVRVVVHLAVHGHWAEPEEAGKSDSELQESRNASLQAQVVLSFQAYPIARCALLEVQVPADLVQPGQSVGSAVFDCFEASLGAEVQIWSYTKPRYQKELNLTQQLPDCRGLEVRDSIQSCWVLPWLNVSTDGDNVLLTLDVSEEQDFSFLLYLRPVPDALKSLWYKNLTGPQNITLNHTDLVPCLCIQVWSLEPDSERVEFCPFREDPGAHRNLWHIARLRVLSPGVWQLDAPCCLPGKVTLCWQAPDQSPCQPLVPPVPQKNATVNEPQDFQLVAGHPNLCVQVSTWEKVQLQACLWADSLGPFKDDMLLVEMKTGLNNTSVCALEPSGCTPLPSMASTRAARLGEELLQDFRSHQCMQLWNDDNMGSLWACPMDKYIHRRWVLVWLACLLLAAALFFFLLLKKDRRKAARGSRTALLLHSADGAGYERLVGALASALSQMPLRVAVDLWSRRELSAHGALAWFHHQRRRILQEGGVVILLFSPAAVAQCQQWLQLQTVEPGPHDALAAWLSCVLPDFLQGRATGRYVGVYFDGLLHPDSVPSPFRVAPLFSLPSQLPAFLDALQGGCSTSAGRPADRVERVTQALRSALAPASVIMAAPLALVLVVAVTVRAALFRSSLAEFISERVEVVSPLSSWKRVVEGLALLDLGVSPYSGAVFHETPLIIYLFHFLIDYAELVFMITDALTAIALYFAIQDFNKVVFKKQKLLLELDQYAPDVAELIRTPMEMRYIPLKVALFYLLNPYTILSCVAKSTCAINNTLIAFFILTTIKGSVFLSAVFLALATYQSLYPVTLFAPGLLYLLQRQYIPVKVKSKAFWIFSWEYAMMYTGSLVVIVCLSFFLLSSWDFIPAVYGFILSVPDLTPNIGLFWYFFAEMFEHFSLFFVCVFQINVFFYTVPLAIKLKEHPIFFMFIQIAIISIFKSYPTVGDVALYMAFFPVWNHLYRFLRNIFVLTCIIIVCSLLFPVLWHLWIYAGSANSNFFYAITLTFNVGQILLISDYFYAFLRREYYLTHGLYLTAKDGTEAMLVLK